MTTDTMRDLISIVQESFDVDFSQTTPLRYSLAVDDPLLEGFLDNARQMLGNKANEIVTTVSNSTQAMQAIYHALSNINYQNTAAFLMKKQLKQLLKQLQPSSPKLYAALSQRFPQGRTLKDFLTAILLVSIARAYLRKGQLTKVEIGDQLQDLIISKLQEWSNKLLDPTGLLAALDGLAKILKISNLVVFEPLANMAKKIATSPVNPKSPTSVTKTNLSK